MLRRFPLYFAISLVLASCGGTYESTALKSWSLMSRGQAPSALEAYDKNVTADRDQLLVMMDKGILHRSAGAADESNKEFFKAAKVIEQNGYISLGEQAATLLSNETITTYQGEDFEKVIVHLYLAMNFLMMKDWDSALVESRRVNEILFKMVSEGKRPYELNAFAKYLTALIFEADHDWNNSLVSLKGTREILPELQESWPTFRIDFARELYRLGMADELPALKDESAVKVAKVSLDSKMASVVLLYESGLSPQKYSSKEYHHSQGKGGTLIEVTVPVAYYKKRPYTLRRARLQGGGTKAESAILFDLEETAIQHLKDRMGRTIAKALLTAATKTGIAVGVGKATKSEGLGLLTGILLFAISEADTRSWLLLPANYQVAKIFLKPGRYEDLRVEFLDSSGRSVEVEHLGPIDLKPQEIRFIQKRTYR